MNRYYTHVHSLFETGIGARILLTDDSIKANLEVRDKVETIRHLSGVRLNDRQEEQLESAIKRLGQLWYAQKHWPGPGPHVQQALTATFACVSRRRRGGGGGSDGTAAPWKAIRSTPTASTSRLRCVGVSCRCCSTWHVPK